MLRPIVISSLLALTLQSCNKQSDDPIDLLISPALETERTIESGKLIGFKDKENTYAWLGIPYAQPPINGLRWRAPQKANSWKGTKQATSFQNICPQIAGMGINASKEETGNIVGSEDCLYLNVWAPQSITQTTKALPVMLWIHGGGNSIGTANTYDYARVLSGKQNVIVVTINYRLGVFGWFKHPALNRSTNPIDQSGNFGTLDIIQSLRWLKENITRFGGDPNNITLFGESAGGFNAYSMMLSPLSKGLFHKVISQSGGIRSSSLAQAQNYQNETPAGHRWSSKEISLALRTVTDGDKNKARAWLSTQQDEDIAAWLRAQSVETIYTLFKKEAASNMGMVSAPYLFRDGAVLPKEDVRDIIDKPSSFHPVPLITGTNRDEMKTFMSQDPALVKYWFGLIPQIRDKQQYQRMAYYNSNIWRIMGADLLATSLSEDSNAPPVYVYRFDFDQLKDSWFLSLSELLGAGHGLEMVYAFGLPGNVQMSFDINDEATLAQRQKLAFAMSSYWANFAYTGSPNRGRNGDLPLWQAWTNEDGAPKTLLLNADNRGGIRQTNEVMTSTRLKQKMFDEFSKEEDQQALCKLYTQVFGGNMFDPSLFDPQEYTNLGTSGCSHP